MMRFWPPAAGDMRFLTPTRPVLCFRWKSSASMYQLAADTFCRGAYFFDRRSRPFRRIRTPSISFVHPIARAAGNDSEVVALRYDAFARSQKVVISHSMNHKGVQATTAPFVEAFLEPLKAAATSFGVGRH